MTYDKTLRFGWDPNKDQTNQQKHGVSFDEAVGLFLHGADYLEIYDEEHSVEEDRFVAIGAIRAGVVVVVYIRVSDGVIRIVSARKATKREVRLLRQHLGGADE